MRFLALLNPHLLVLALEGALQDGRVTRGEIGPIQEKLFAEMTALGQWR